MTTYAVCDIYGGVTFVDAQTFIFEDDGFIEFRPKPPRKQDRYAQDSVERICKKIITEDRKVRFQEVWPVQGELEDWG
jgi:hypothetical protein